MSKDIDKLAHLIAKTLPQWWRVQDGPDESVRPVVLADLIRESDWLAERDAEKFREGQENVQESMLEEIEEPLTYRHPHTGQSITSQRLRRYVTDWEEADRD